MGAWTKERRGEWADRRKKGTSENRMEEGGPWLVGEGEGAGDGAGDRGEESAKEKGAEKEGEGLRERVEAGAGAGV